jgi:hypothetical protein
MRIIQHQSNIFFKSKHQVLVTMIYFSLLYRINKANLQYRVFSKAKHLHRVKKAGAGRTKRDTNLITDNPSVEPKWQGLGWSPVLFLGIAPLIAWIATVSVRPDLRKDLYERLGYADVREHVAQGQHHQQQDVQ